MLGLRAIDSRPGKLPRQTAVGTRAEQKTGMLMNRLAAIVVLTSLCAVAVAKEDISPEKQADFSGLQFRAVGPAFTSGRIADIALRADDPGTWYVAVGSGGVWKTANAGISWRPIFDNEGSYSIGCLTIDPGNSNTIWVGTGENVGGRHVGYGDGVYRSVDGGKSWKNMGLKASEHISRIVVHPEDPNTVWVAAQGPLWSKGGERGLYKSTDGGASWKRVLGDDEWVGATDVVVDPRDPDLLYAATWQRHRNVAAYMGGGPGSGIHRSTDGGETWEKLAGGLPGTNVGKIGLAISPQQPDVVYAAIELERRSGGIYRSADRGASWEKRSDTVAGGTGPHYYQELYASPHSFDTIYLMDMYVQESRDGGRTFSTMPSNGVHSDIHAIAFRADDPDFILLGSDGGLYETLDGTNNWRFIDNLPVAQYYKVAVDDAEPFYNIYGGTQDNGSHGGPSRTDSGYGIRNSDWRYTLGGDGHQSAIEPGNPDITYAQSQRGYLNRIDRLTGERLLIQPQSTAAESLERFNWDAPILVSPFSATRLYFASQRVWRSDDRGDSWAAISGDLTRDENRLHQPIMDRTWGWEAAWDLTAMSTYNSITSLAESPRQEGLIYVGTDDGLIQVTEDGGGSWRRIEVKSIRGVPDTAFVNDIKADLFDADTVYVALDNHKHGDFKPYLFKSTNRGRSWKSIVGDIPDRSLVWRVVQDHVKSGLLFAATEFGIYYTADGGGKWHKLAGGVPTIAFRDLAIQRRENDLVGASFGRGFFVLDDYSPLREIGDGQLQRAAMLFQPRKAWWYQPKRESGMKGTGEFIAQNPPFGAAFTYYLADGFQTLEAQRRKRTQELEKAGEAVTLPSWDELQAERMQFEPKIWLTVRDETGAHVRTLEAPATAGFHRVAWDLRHTSRKIVALGAAGGRHGAGSGGAAAGYMAVPGVYSVSLASEVDGKLTELAGPVRFEVTPLRQAALQGASIEEYEAFRLELQAIEERVDATGATLNATWLRVAAVREAATRIDARQSGLTSRLRDLQHSLQSLTEQLYGDPAKGALGHPVPLKVNSWLSRARAGASTSYGPTPSHRESLRMAAGLLQDLVAELNQIRDVTLPAIEQALAEAGAPWIEGQPLPQ